MVEKDMPDKGANDIPADLAADESVDASVDSASSAGSASSTGESASSAGSAGKGTAKKKRNKKLILGVSAVVIVAAIAIGGVGFSVWHEQPGFCNTICHQPMDAYVDGYNNDETIFLAAHKTEAVNCIDCHDPGIGEQIKEGVTWMQGDFTMDDEGHMLATVGVRADAKQCATPECHDFNEVIALTENYGGEEGVNPHQSHQGTAIDCSNCHSSHETSYMFCNTCHDYQLPDGWANPVKTDSAL